MRSPRGSRNGARACTSDHTPPWCVARSPPARGRTRHSSTSVVVRARWRVILRPARFGLRGVATVPSTGSRKPGGVGNAPGGPAVQRPRDGRCRGAPRPGTGATVRRDRRTHRRVPTGFLLRWTASARRTGPGTVAVPLLDEATLQVGATTESGRARPRRTPAVHGDPRGPGRPVGEGPGTCGAHTANPPKSDGPYRLVVAAPHITEPERPESGGEPEARSSHEPG